MTIPAEAIRVLRCAGELSDDGLDLAETALALAVLDYAEADLESCRQHLDELVNAVRQEGAATKLDDRLRLLRRVLVIQNKYCGVEDAHGDWSDANLAKVIERRRGSSTALGIIYLHVADRLGWPMSGLGFPTHFFVKLTASDGRAILDPSRSGQTCSSDDLRNYLLPNNPNDIERLSDYYMPISKRDILLRLQNNIKRRQLSADHADAAVNTLQSMILIAPRRQELWRELGYMQAERGNLRSAITALEIVCDLSQATEHDRQAEVMASQLRRQLN